MADTWTTGEGTKTVSDKGAPMHKSKDSPRTGNLGADLTQLAHDHQGLSSPKLHTNISQPYHDFILLTPVKIGLTSI